MLLGTCIPRDERRKREGDDAERSLNGYIGRIGESPSIYGKVSKPGNPDPDPEHLAEVAALGVPGVGKGSALSERGVRRLSKSTGHRLYGSSGGESE